MPSVEKCSARCLNLGSLSTAECKVTTELIKVIMSSATFFHLSYMICSGILLLFVPCTFPLTLCGHCYVYVKYI